MKSRFQENVNLFLFARKNFKPQVVSLNPTPCPEHPDNHFFDPNNMRKIGRFGLDVVGAQWKLMFTASALAVTAMGGANILEAIAENNIPHAIEQTKSVVSGDLISLAMVGGTHYLQKRFGSAPVYNPGDLVPTRNDTTLRIIK